VSHFNLIVQCFDECGSDISLHIYKKLFHRIKSWTECLFKSESYRCIVTAYKSCKNVQIHMIPILLDLIENSIKCETIEFLGELENSNKKIVNFLIKFLNHNNKYVRDSTVCTLDKLGNVSKEAVDILFKCLKYED